MALQALSVRQLTTTNRRDYRVERHDLTESAQALAEEEAVELTINNQTIAVCRTLDGLYAVSGICTHATASLAEGFVMDQFIECPLHQAQFDLTTGERVSGPECAALKTYPLTDSDGRVMIDVPDA